MLTSIVLASAQIAAPVVEPADPPADIVITASRVPQDQTETAASATIVDEKRIERLGEPLLYPILRLTPSAAVQSTGPAGSFVEVRIRGAEANHTLLFVDGIRANDPAANDTPRFELLNADIASRLEVVRGPQSALWGSEAIGGVIAVNGIAKPDNGVHAATEAGSFGFRRASASATINGDDLAVAGALGWQRASGIDSFRGGGDRDGYRNLAGRLRVTWAPAASLEVGISGFSLNGRSQYDGIDLLTFARADTLDSTRNRLSAGRAWVSFGEDSKGLAGAVSASLLDSTNRNFLDDQLLNRTSGERQSAAGQFQYRFATGPVSHTAVLALDHDRERFEARDVVFGGASNQDRERTHDAITGEWRAELTPLVLDLALRRDRFSDFDDATTVRASALADIGRGFAVAASYGEGIARPTFFDLYGFFPGTFVGNPSLKPESSRGYELALRYRQRSLEASLTAYRQRLHDEIVDVFNSATFQSSTENRASVSKRSGVEAALGWAPSERLRLSASYAFLDAEEPGRSGPNPVREIRRPKHSGSVALDGLSGRLTYGASVAYTGTRGDINFDVFPAERVRLSPYWLAGARIAYALRPQLHLFARASNLFDERYQDVFGYRTEGRAVFAGIRLGGP